METIHNKTDSMVTDMIDGYVGANSALLERLDRTKSILVRNAGERVMVLAGGGADVSRCISAVQGSKWQMQ